MRKLKFNKIAFHVLSSVCILGILAFAGGCGKDKPADNSGVSPDVSTSAATKNENSSTKNNTQSESTTAVNNGPAGNDIPAVNVNSGDVVVDLPASAKGFSMRQVNGITYVNGILVANKTYDVPSSYNPGQLLEKVNDAFNIMKADAAKEGLNLYVASGFRSFQRQEYLYNNYVSRDGKSEADRYSARAGFSEHQTGLAFDLNTVEDSFANTPESKWVAKNAHKYGFIIRYPKEKESITGYIYEPWHLRYLGNDLATAVYNSGLCLEEYLGIDSSYMN